MRAIVYTATGDPSVLKLVDREVPTPGPGEVRIKVAVSAVNPTDWKSRAGSGAGGDLPFPEIVPNLDGAGVIDAVGAGVDGLAVGDRVWTYLAAHQRPTGTAQEFTVLPAARAVKLPDPASFDQGASMGVPALTAHRALTVNETGPSRLHPGALTGKTVLVAGGAGAVGHAAIQLARWAGATVITTISSDAKANLAAAAGAHHTVNYRDQDAAAVIG
ncbi:MAG: zinc-binding dehydrogenase, partial [Nakamurella sp.]